VSDSIDIAPHVDPARTVLAFDPQTSGGLLAAVPGTGLPDVERSLRDAGERCWRIGRVETGAGLVLR